MMPSSFLADAGILLKLKWWKSSFKLSREFLVVQWLGISAFTAESSGSIPGWETKIPQAVQYGQANSKNK